MKTHRIVLATTFLVWAPGLIFAQSAPMRGMDMSKEAPATQAYMRAMTAMHDQMQAMTPTNDPDKDFVLMMKPHHQAAVDMAEAYLKYGSDPQLKKMARDIVSSQTAEIRQMDAWRAKAR